MRLRIELAISEGSWPGLRQTLLEKKPLDLMTGQFRPWQMSIMKAGLRFATAQQSPNGLF